MTLQLELGTLCNSHCIYCEQGNNSLNASYAFRSFAEVRKVLDSSFRQGYGQLFLQGGEPTIHPDIVKIISYAKHLGFGNVAMITNGRMLSYPKFAKDIIQAGLDDVTFSIQSSDPKVHDFISQSEGSFDQALLGLKNLLSFGFKGNITNSTTIIRQNYKSLSSIVDKLYALRVLDFHFIFVIPYDSVVKNDNDVVMALEVVVQEVNRLVADWGKKVHIKVENIPICYLDKAQCLNWSHKSISTVRVNNDSITDYSSTNSKDWLKPDDCKRCSSQLSCCGFHRNYIGIYGIPLVSPTKD